MDLADAALYFDDSQAYDGYDGTSLFKCQLDPLEMFKVDATAVKRRAMSCAPGTSMPAKGVIEVGNIKYVVGGVSPDMFYGDVIRDNYVLQGVTHSVKFLTIAQLLGNATVDDTHVSFNFNKYQTDERTSSEYFAQYLVYAASSEAAPEIVKIGPDLYHVRNGYVGTAGMLILLVNHIPEPTIETVTTGSQTYDPITDTFTDTTTTVTFLRMRYTEEFEYLNNASTKYERGDLHVRVLKTAATPKVSDTIDFSDGGYKILSVADYGLTWGIHARHV